VADSPDANPEASRNFLNRFDRTVERLANANPVLWNGGCDAEKLRDVLVEATEELILEVDYKGSTTFTCLIVVQEPDRVKGLILHAGDSCLFSIDPYRGDVSQLSWTNLNFIGKCDVLSQVELVEIRQSTRFMICTDGLQALARNKRYQDLQEILMESFSQSEVDTIPDILIDHYGRDIDLPDDVTILALNPNRLPGTGNTAIRGGVIFSPTV